MRIAPMFVGLTLAVLPGIAFADASVAGYWKADLGSNVTIEMNVTPDGQWDSQTAQGSETVAEMAGTYSQKVNSPTTGNLVFVPTKSHVTAQHGAPKIEHDTYRLSDDGQMMQLTSSGDTLEFRKQTR